MKREDVLAVYVARPDAVVALVEWLLGELQGQMTQVAELTALLSQDSHNSHHPPSSDGPATLRVPPGAAGVSARQEALRACRPSRLTLLQVEQSDKVSGGFRSLAGAEIFCRIRGYLSTMRQQSHTALAVLTSVVTGRPTQPQLTG